ncbi:MAG: alkaline phosphatase [Alphaproteobacteria bacterium]|nr:alkaline phosphatase [Alphaproteobacteria bacterium]
MRVFALLVAGGLATSLTATAADGPLKQANDPYYQSAEAQLRATLARTPNTRRAKNIILFVGDGMGITTVTAARIYQGQKAGRDGVSNKLTFEQLPYAAFSRTYSHDSQVTDSAPSASAMTTGVKSQNGAINVSSVVAENDCAAGLANPTTTIAELAEIAGMSTGAVTTTRVTHATPAATYAHSAGRDWEDDSDMKPEHIAAGCVDIARQLIDMRPGDGLDVVMGGGRNLFRPNTVADPEYPEQKGTRKDGRDLIEAWLRRYRGNATYIWNREGFDALDPTRTKRVLALFEPENMAFELDRPKDRAGEPSLAEMTAKAIAILRRNPKGYFLLVEGGRIDHAHHGSNAARALEDAVAFDAAVRVALDRVDLRDTLMIVTADHSHVFTMAGYPSRKNPILGLVDGPDDKPVLALDQKPYTTLGYANGPGAAEKGELREDPSTVDTTAPDYRQQSAVPLRWETHGGEDVPIYASGPWAHLFQGAVDQQYIFHVMNFAGRIKDRAEAATRQQRKRRR